jgi:hypothetical protein
MNHPANHASDNICVNPSNRRHLRAVFSDYPASSVLRHGFEKRTVATGNERRQTCGLAPPLG